MWNHCPATSTNTPRPETDGVFYCLKLRSGYDHASMAKHRVRRLPGVEAAYIAGLVDGEGTIALTRKYRHQNRQLTLSISSTEPAMLRYVLRTIGAGRITTKRTYRSNHSPSYTYAVSNRQALDVIGQVFPYLRSYKLKRAKLVLNEYIQLTPRNGKYSPEMARARERFICRFLATRAHPAHKPAQKRIPKAQQARK